VRELFEGVWQLFFPESCVPGYFSESSLKKILEVTHFESLRAFTVLRFLGLALLLCFLFSLQFMKYHKCFS